MTPVQIRPELLLMNIKNNNMKKILFLLFIFPIVFSLTEETKIFDQNETYVLEGRTILVSNIFENSIIASVDRSKNEIIEYNETIKLNEVNLTVSNIIYASDQKSVELDIVILNKYMCDKDSECDDGDISTKDTCNLQKNICKYEEISSCKDNDGYCPSKCSKYNDNDCNNFCKNNDECDDGNSCTVDFCNGDSKNPGKCEYNPITECSSSDNCCPNGCSEKSKIFESYDSDCNELNECISDSDCNDYNISTDDICFGDGILIPKTCQFTINDICKDNDGYCNYNCNYINDNDCKEPQKIDSSFCEKGGEKFENNLSFYCDGFKYYPKKVGGSDCNYDYECRLNICNEGVCISDKDINIKENNKNLLLGFSVFFIFVIIYYFYLNKMKNNNI